MFKYFKSNKFNKKFFQEERKGQKSQKSCEDQKDQKKQKKRWEHQSCFDWYVITVLLSLCLILFVPQALYADMSMQSEASDDVEFEVEFKNIEEHVKKEVVFKKGSNVVYRFLDNNGYIFAIISGSAAGMIRCGVICAIIGGTAGAVDELFIYPNMGRRYLTWGILGITSGYAINNRMPSHMFDIVGVVVGILLPTGMLNDHKELIAPAASIVAGNSLGGVSGVIGKSAGFLDEILLDKNIEDKHYLTFCVIGVATANLLGSGYNQIIVDTVGVALGLIATNYEEAIFDSFLIPIEVVGSLYEVYSKFIPKEQLDNHIETHILSLVGSQFLTQSLALQIRKYSQNLGYNFERLDNPNGPAWNNIKLEMVNFAIFVFPYALGQIFSSNVDHYFDKKLHVALEEQIRAELFSGEVALRLSHDQNNTVLIDSLKEDVSTVVGSGSWLITSAISTSIGGIYGVGLIINCSPNIFVYSTVYHKAQSYVANLLADQRRLYGKKIRELDSKLVTTLKHDAEHIRTIMEQGGIEITKEKIQQLSAGIRDLEGAQKLWSMASSLWWSILGTADYVVDYFLVGREIHQGRIPFANRGDIQAANWQASSLLSWSGHQAQMIAEIEQSLDRVIILEERIHALPSKLDQIIRIVKAGRGGEKATAEQLIFQDLEVGIGDRVLVTIGDLKLDMGKTYAITGETGCGKTSLLSKIRGLKENGVFGKGYIYYPGSIIRDMNEGRVEKQQEKQKEQIVITAPKIVMLSQQDYFPLDSSLYDIISYPDKIFDDQVLNKEKRKKVSLLLKEIKLHAFRDKISSVSVEIKGDTEIQEDTAMVCQKETDNEVREGKGGEKEINSDKEILDLDSKKDWYTYLSGGEKKKIKIISAIIKKPDILILDEIFSGLDPASIAIVQRMLKKYLPNTLILSVDHHACDNNHDNFYNSELHFYNKELIFRKMCDQ